MASADERPVFLTREADHFRLAFPFDPELVKRMHALPYAQFDKGATRTWTVLVCTQAVERLRTMYYEGLVGPSPDELLVPGETLASCTPALLRSGSRARPFIVHTAWRDDQLYSRLRSIVGAAWDKRLGALTYPASASAALGELVENGTLADPESLLRPADTTVSFDARTGKFKVFGDPRAQLSFDQNFPKRDVVDGWRERGLDVAFSDPFTEEVYAGELARSGDIIQPEGLLLPLFDYQARSVAFALARSGAGVFHSPGLGKSAVGTAIGFQLLNEGRVPRVVVLCPGGIRSQFADEITRFTGHTDVVVIDGDKKRRLAAYAAAEHARWLVVNYDILSRDVEYILPLCKGAAIVADEAHRLKNPVAARTKTARKLAKAATHVTAMTGTPVESVPDEWFWTLTFAVPNALGDSQDYCNRYMFPSRWGGFEGKRNLPELARRSAPHFIRYTKQQVATHLPPLIVQHMPLDPEPAYANALRRAHREARDEIAAARREKATMRAQAAGNILNGNELDDVESGAEMTAIGMLRALCTSPRLLQHSDSPAAQLLVDAGVVPDADGPKLDTLRELASGMQANNERVVIFTYSKTMADLIAQRFTEDGIRHVSFTGDTSSADRDIARRRFNDPDDDVCAFIATDAGAEGLNLGRCCSTLINVDVPWTPTRLEQRSNRIHRIDGTAPSYLVINMTVRGTVEDGILRLVESKADLADSILGEAGGKARTTGRHMGRRFLEQALKSYFDAGGDAGEKRKPSKALKSKTAETAEAGDVPADVAGDGVMLTGGEVQPTLLDIPVVALPAARASVRDVPDVAVGAYAARAVNDVPLSVYENEAMYAAADDPIPGGDEGPVSASAIDAADIRSARIRYTAPPQAEVGGRNVRAETAYADIEAVANAF